MTARNTHHVLLKPIAPSLVAVAAAAVRLLWSWCHRSRHRRRLAELDDYMLRDIGLTRREIEAEARKPFWRA